ncbi:MAG: DUF4270 domain-containing protein [Flavobacteriales bacterium]|nr:DUF4270 domain-containing protein [Flavobacteriales bacterium]
MVALLFFGACKKPENTLGLELIDPNDTLSNAYADTTSLVTYAIPGNPVRTSGLSRNALGSYVDPDFGQVKAGIVTQFRLSANNVGSGQNNHALVADSLVLSLVFDGTSYAYNGLQEQVFRVYEIADALTADSIYQNDDRPVVAQVNDLVARPRGLFKPDPFRGPVVGGDTLKPQVRIPLDKALADRFMSAWGSADLANSANFLQFFKGLWVTPDNMYQAPLMGGVLYFNLLDAQTKLTLYYRNTRPGDEDTTSFDFVINDQCVRYTRCEHEPAQAARPYLPMQLQDSTLGQVRTYVQAMGGVRTEVRFPNLLEYKAAGLIAVAKAELIVPLDGPFLDQHPPPAQLFAFRKGDEGQDLIMPDQIPGQGDIGGVYNASAKEYRFNITRWVQGVLSGTYPNTGLGLVPSGSGVAVNRVILAGPEHPQRPMRLKLTFTTF